MVGAKTEDGEVIVTVSDTGEGIPPELLPHIFERYRHGDESGAGLGLDICKEIIETHGGRIWLTSGQGKGTAAFALPVCEGDGQSE